MSVDTTGATRRFRARLCAGGCGLRFPVDDGSPLGERCPLCGAPTQFVDEPYTSAEVPTPAQDRPTTHAQTASAASVDLGAGAGGHTRRLGLLLDNVRSLRNVGGIFRTADGVGVSLAVLAGITPTPAHPGFAKTALGAELSVPWRRHADAIEAATQCLAEGWSLWALEGGERAVDLFAAQTRAAAHDRAVMLVLGHEVSGVDPRVLALCERVVFIPMLGHKRSLNVSVAFGIAAYALRAGLGAHVE
ncbi:MAG: hypothetical protein IPH07_38250 [Deltaproteobacteria bacterium]|jgi:23S rRNA (guanosine2251-2'-O)-methyltransferase|nr:hypothetical protein [Deltaproteobacteria bacterium]MBK8713670.1 hypothetical protein [Deltaproteobacteria bacterium]MBP7288857.1 hypothetical protein [Nannocystaceae bacterium]